MDTQKCFETNADTYLALLHVRSAPLRTCLSILQDYYSTALVEALFQSSTGHQLMQTMMTVTKKHYWKDKQKNYDTLRNYNFIPIGSTVAVQ